MKERDTKGSQGPHPLRLFGYWVVGSGPQHTVQPPGAGGGVAPAFSKYWLKNSLGLNLVKRKPVNSPHGL